jgi:predicted amidohydrolase YtcJ
VLRGGKVITVDEKDRIAEAVALTGNRIIAVGSSDEIGRFVGPGTKVIELKGRVLLPGFIDSHSHVQGLAESEHAMVPIQEPPLIGAAEIIAKLKERAAQVPPGTWIVGQGTYNQEMPTREDLDRNFPDHPVVLPSVSFLRFSLGATKLVPADQGPSFRTHEGSTNRKHKS